MEFPTGTYRTIYIDPPWPESGGGRICRGAQQHYELMSVEQIKALPVGDLADRGGGFSHLPLGDE